MTDERVIRAWQANADPWTSAIREKRIASRKLVTNSAIIDAVMSRAPKDIIDIGCGEGWLVRALAERGVRGLRVDVVPGLIESARAAGGGDFRVASYEDIVAGKLDALADLAVGNRAAAVSINLPTPLWQAFQPSPAGREGPSCSPTMQPVVRRSGRS